MRDTSVIFRRTRKIRAEKINKKGEKKDDKDKETVRPARRAAAGRAHRPRRVRGYTSVGRRRAGRKLCGLPQRGAGLAGQVRQRRLPRVQRHARQHVRFVRVHRSVRGRVHRGVYRQPSEQQAVFGGRQQSYVHRGQQRRAGDCGRRAGLRLGCDQRDVTVA